MIFKMTVIYPVMSLLALIFPTEMTRDVFEIMRYKQ